MKNKTSSIYERKKVKGLFVRERDKMQKPQLCVQCHRDIIGIPHIEGSAMVVLVCVHPDCLNYGLVQISEEVLGQYVPIDDDFLDKPF